MRVPTYSLHWMSRENLVGCLSLRLGIDCWFRNNDTTYIQQVVPFNFYQTKTFAVSLGVYVDFIVLAYLRCRCVSRKSMSYSAAQADQPTALKSAPPSRRRGRCRRYRWKASNMRQKFQLPLPEGGVQMHPGFLVRQSNRRSKSWGLMPFRREGLPCPPTLSYQSDFSIFSIFSRDGSEVFHILYLL